MISSKPIPSRLKPTRSRLIRIYRTLRNHFGHRHWWPGETPFEIIVGAILTQNVSWTNVEKAIIKLKKAGALSPSGLDQIQLPKLARLIRSTRYFNLKARRLKAFVTFLSQRYHGSLKRMFRTPLHELREQLLEVKGIGEETADSILLYAGHNLSFVIDAYTRRLLKRHGYLEGNESYGELQSLFSVVLPKSVPLYNDFHAQIVEVGKNFCTPRNPRCSDCPLRPYL